MNDRTPFERQVADRIAEEPRSVPLPRAFITELTAQADDSGQRPRWLALLKEPPMRTNSSTIVGSPTVRVAAIMVATFLLAVALAAAGVAGQRLLAAEEEPDARTLVVDQDGNGDYATITDAVAMANDGDTILVRPGRYVESVVVDKDVVIAGDGDAADIIVRFPVNGPRAPFHSGSVRYAFDLSGSAATLRDFTITGQEQDGAAVIVRDGSPTLDRVAVDLPWWSLDDDPILLGMAFVGAGADLTLNEVASSSLLWVGEGGSATVTDSRYDGWGQSHPGFEVHLYDGSTATIRGSELNHVDVRDGSSAIIEDNTFVGGLSSCGIDLTNAGSSTVVRGNTLESNGASICVAGGNGTLIEANHMQAAFGGLNTALRIDGSDAVIRGNTIEGSMTGVALDGGAPTFEDNIIEDNRVGFKLSEDAAPIMTGNRICGNTTDVEWPPESEPPDLSANETCDD